MKTIMFFHGDCLDAAFSADLMTTYIKNKHGKQHPIVYVPCEYNEVVDFSIVEKGDQAYILDYHFSIEDTIALEKKVNLLVMIDHHKVSGNIAKAMQEHYSKFKSERNYLIIVDYRSCTCQLILSDLNVKTDPFLRHIASYVADNGRFELKNSKKINAALKMGLLPFKENRFHSFLTYYDILRSNDPQDQIRSFDRIMSRLGESAVFVGEQYVKTPFDISEVVIEYKSKSLKICLINSTFNNHDLARRFLDYSDVDYVVTYRVVVTTNSIPIIYGVVRGESGADELANIFNGEGTDTAASFCCTMKVFLKVFWGAE